MLIARRTLTSTSPLSLAQPGQDAEQLNEAQRYLANKAARKAARSSNPHSASARHASLYSQLFPALLRILAYGSTAYFGLHLLWNVLDRDEQRKLMDSQTSGLEATARSLAEKVEKAKEQVAPTTTGTEDRKNKKWYWPF